MILEAIEEIASVYTAEGGMPSAVILGADSYKLMMREAQGNVMYPCERAINEGTIIMKYMAACGSLDVELSTSVSADHISIDGRTHIDALTLNNLLRTWNRLYEKPKNH